LVSKLTVLGMLYLAVIIFSSKTPLLIILSPDLQHLLNIRLFLLPAFTCIHL